MTSFIYEEFKLVLLFGPYHIVDEAKIAPGFVFNKRRDGSLLQLVHMFAYVGAHIVPISQSLI